jgi:hypothetical protein
VCCRGSRAWFTIDRRQRRTRRGAGLSAMRSALHHRVFAATENWPPAGQANNQRHECLWALVLTDARPYHPAMGPRIPRKRRLIRKIADELGVSSRGDAQTPSADQGPAQETSARGQEGNRSRKPPSGGVTHRSPSPDDMLLPCCGRALSEVGARDQVTTDPALVTCNG